jgi:hypothetical protein
MSKVIFLDFDGVVNTCRWYKTADGKWKSKFNFPKDGKVNNEDAVQWVSELCQKFGYDIVISSTWRMDGLKTCEKCLRNAGLREGIKVVGATPILHKYRGFEIKQWLEEHPEVTEYLIIDDDCDMVFPELLARFVQCRQGGGFTVDEYGVAMALSIKYSKEE